MNSYNLLICLKNLLTGGLRPAVIVASSIRSETPPMSAIRKTEQLSRLLMEHYGALMGGADLYRTLGFPSSAAFTRAKAADLVGVHVFKLPGRKGTFALTTDVAEWLSECSPDYSHPEPVKPASSRSLWSQSDHEA